VYQLIEGYDYNGPRIREIFFYTFDNAEKSALLFIKIMTEASRCRECWTELVDAKELEGIGAERAWILLDEEHSDYKLSKEQRVQMHVMIKKIEMDDSLEIDGGLQIYKKHERN